MLISIILQFVAACFGTIAFSILFFVPREYYPYCGMIGGGAWVICWCFTHYLGYSDIIGTFAATAFVVLVSRIYGVRKKCPATLFMLPGIFPLVPGVGIYWTAYYVITGEMNQASAYGRHTFGIGMAIVLGIIFVFEIPQKSIRRLFGGAK